MICSRCRNRLFLRLAGLSHGNRPQASFLHSSTTADTPSPRQSASQPSTNVNASTPSAISASTPGLSQPLSTPDFPSSSRPPPGTLPPQQRTREPSSVPGGTQLKGVAYMKNKPTILAKEDSEYPDWLWGLLEKDDANAENNDGIDPSTMNKKARIRHARKMAAIEATRPKKVPIHEQSIDLTTPDAPPEEHLQKMKELTQSARMARRKSIRESNFLKGL